MWRLYFHFLYMGTDHFSVSCIFLGMPFIIQDWKRVRFEGNKVQNVFFTPHHRRWSQQGNQGNAKCMRKQRRTVVCEACHFIILLLISWYNPSSLFQQFPHRTQSDQTFPPKTFHRTQSDHTRAVVLPAKIPSFGTQSGYSLSFSTINKKLHVFKFGNLGGHRPPSRLPVAVQSLLNSLSGPWHCRIWSNGAFSHFPKEWNQN